MRPRILIILICCLSLPVLSPSAFAHKVNIFAFVEGDTVYTESYFPDGKKVEGGKIEIYDSQNKKLLEGITDNEGQFNFKPTKKDNLRIVINASMGHRNSYILSKDELPELVNEDKKMSSNANRRIAEIDAEQIRKIVDASLEQKLRLVMQKLARLEEERVSYRDVIGGIGYIFGIAGIVFYCLRKRRNG